MRSSSPPDIGAALDAAVHEYRQDGDVGALLDRVKAAVREAPADALGSAAAPYMDLPEVVIPVYERIVELAPGFGEYEKRTDRVIPVFELTPNA